MKKSLSSLSNQYYFPPVSVGAINAKCNKAVKGATIRINEKNLGIFSISASRHPEMKGFESRQHSFQAQDWPKQKQNLIPKLCKAGFYYTGIEFSMFSAV